MRELERIKRILTLLEKIWEKSQDVRFNQLIDHLQFEYASGNDMLKTYYQKDELIGEVITFIPTSTADLFYVEDDNFEKFLEEYLLTIDK